MADGEFVEMVNDGINAHGADLSSCTNLQRETPFEVEEITDCSLDKIAARLLKGNFILTALEFHTELVESGRELPRLRDYFSNPGNFEKHSLICSESPPILPRTSSVQTFDSLDFARYSDDGERQVDEKVAVLEFELRKAKETINALRTNLTVATESEPNTPISGTTKLFAPEAVKPHEKRALNFLVNEYLLKHNYKLTSITLSDENEDQDFEDWDDVGLNIPKPPDLLQLYRNYCRHIYSTVNVCNSETQTDPVCSFNDEIQSGSTEENWEANQRLDFDEFVQEKDKMLVQERDDIISKRKALKREIKVLDQKKGTAAILTDDQKLNVVHKIAEQPPICDSDNSDNQEYVIVNPFISDVSKNSSLDSESPNAEMETTDDVCNASGFINDAPVLESTTLQSEFCNRHLSPEFIRVLKSLCHTQKISHSRLVSEVSDVINSSEKVVTMLARCLPHIVPNVLLAKRDELLPLILCTITLHPDAKQRDMLLNVLFNLIKKPDEEQRQMILKGLAAIAQHLGPSRVEAELLPQCWEQITHRYTERRLLVAESCGVLASYLPTVICSSLLLSMLQQMLQEDKDELVREMVVRNLALLLTRVDDGDKFFQATQLLLLALKDRSMNVCEAGLNTLLPSIAEWALELDRLESHLLPNIMKALEEQCLALSQKPATMFLGPSPAEEQLPVLFLRAIQILLNFLLIAALQTGPYMDNMEQICNSPSELDVDRLPAFQCVLHDPGIVLGDRNYLSNLIKAFDKYISAEWYKPWEKYDWLSKSFLQWLLHILNLVNPQRQAVVHSLTEMVHAFCHLFGRPFTQTIVKPVFREVLFVPNEEIGSDLHTVKLSFIDATVPVYVVGVMTAFHQEEDQLELSRFLQEILYLVSFSQTPIDSMKSTIVELSVNKLYHELLLSILWDGVVHTSSLVRVTAGRLFEVLVGVVSESLLRTRVTPALVTLASDPEITVRVATVPAFGAIMEISSQKDLLEKVHLQLQTFLDDPVYWDQYSLHVEVIRTFAKVGPNTEPKFRDDFVLPRLAAIAAQNNSSTDESKKVDIALALLDAYVAMSCCFMGDQLITEAFLPGLRCLKQDLQIIAPEHEESVNTMIREFEAKVGLNRSMEKYRPNSLSIPSPGSMEDMKNRVTKIFTTRPTGPKANIPNLFQLRKK